jgi:cell division septum initiation protein DivIVA
VKKNRGTERKEENPINDITHLIDRLERLLNESWRMPLSAYLVINEDDFLDVIDQMRTAIPKEIREAEKIQRERERLIAQAEEEADRIVKLAQEDADRLIDEHEIIQGAAKREQTIIERAQREAEVLKGEADEYARSVLISLNEQLGAVDNQIAVLLKTVRNGLDTLSQPLEPAPDEMA